MTVNGNNYNKISCKGGIFLITRLPNEIENLLNRTDDARPTWGALVQVGRGHNCRHRHRGFGFTDIGYRSPPHMRSLIVNSVYRLHSTSLTLFF